MNAEDQHRRSELLREFFLNASLIALIKELGEEMATLESLTDEGAGDLPEFGLPPIPAA